MDPGLAAVLVTVLLLVLLGVGVHIGVALGVTGFLGLLLTLGERAALGQLQTIPFSVVASFSLGVVPMFVLMGAFFSRAGYTAELYAAAYNWLGGLRGGLAMATTAGCAGMGAITGSSVANAAVFTRIAVPEMVNNGYDKRLATACVAASGTLASLIPPSILAVVYGIVTETSVGKVLIAGFVPGILSASIYMLGIYLRVVWNPALAPAPAVHITWRTRFASLRPLWAVTAIFALVIGGIYSGLFTPTFAGAVGAAGAFVLALARRMRPPVVWEAIREAGVLTATILIIVVGGFIFARFLAFTGIIRHLTDAMLGLQVPPFAYLAVYSVVMVVLGMFLEAFSMMVLTLPVFFPILVGVGYDPVWLGIVTIKLIEMGLVTPPVGLNVYVVRASSPVPVSMEDLFQGIMPFLLMDVLTLALFVMFPQIILFLPDLMS